jgi:Ca2+-transporting ATPase
VTKETADMVLLDDRYTSIVKAVEQGRGIYENIKKFVNYLLSSNLGEVLILFIAMIIGFRDSSGTIVMPLLATQILWMNLVTDGLPAVAIGVDPIRKGIMNAAPRNPDEPIITKDMVMNIVAISLVDPIRKGIMNAAPRNPDEPIITKDMVMNIVAISLLMAAGVLFLFNRFLPQGEVVGRTVAFTTIVMLEMVRVTMIRSQYRLPLFSNLFLIGAIMLSVLLQVAVVYVPVMNVIFKTTPLAFYHWSYIGAVMAVMFVIGTITAKWIHR